MNAPLRIALLTPFFWPEVERGTERIVAELAADLVVSGQRPRVITSHPGRGTTRVERGVEVVRNRRPPEGLLLRRGFQPHLSHTPLSLISLLRADDDLAHAFYPTDAAAAIRWGARRNRPTVFSYMGVPRRAVLASRRLSFRLVTDAVDKSDAVVTLSKAAAGAMKRWLGVEPRVIYPGVDLERFAPGGSRSEAPTIACAAAPDDGRKRVELLARAFRRVRRERPGARLLLAHPRREPDVAERLAAISEGIEFFDGPPERVAEVFREAWVSALTSHDEAFGLVLVESLACGTPVVGPRGGGVAEIVDDSGVGLLFESDDEKTVAQCLLEALDLNGDPKTPARCRKRATRFSTARCAAEHLELYRELVATR